MDWLTIESLTDIEKAVEDSYMENKKAVILFKHSTRCSISSTAKFRLENSLKSNPDFIAYYLDLLKNRELSNHLAERFSVRHESPQAIVLKNGKCIYHASHLSISINDIEIV
jgi:bacillithiol system protein YtxJ